MNNDTDKGHVLPPSNVLSSLDLCMPAAKRCINNNAIFTSLSLNFTHHDEFVVNFTLQCQACGIVSMPEVENLYKGVGFW